MSTPTPLKLTDEVLGEIEAAVWDMHTIEGRGRELMRAIRNLRDRARAVVDDAQPCEEPGCDGVRSRFIRALREVLPEAKP